ncbi:hypothetical protein G6F62_001137 [Rhizopus arrhizus]|nr:hypothetical protein G6F23_004234 [Rhizopus arrhizus]KAG0762466.1 hypothetical protein G6F24_006781 [Rhizopus arrhizus]KAG0788909.1 hypothetical protein G6F21_006879 [Rhizopus arrhizus]KAG0801870.1 hypothetical protein G6F22_000822 [Rhizopus arrhizus]KAG0810831.1 hypothetical protein G6F20_007648 [Rhizopus arrhizus]
MDITKIIFLIDIQCILKDHLSTKQLKLALQRICLYYHLQDQSKIIVWSYRLFDTLANYMLSNTPELYELEDLVDVKDLIEKDCERYSSSSSSSSDAPFTRLKQVMKELFGDFSWEVDHNVVKSRSSSKKHPPQQKHHVYAFMPLPHTFPDLTHFFTNVKGDKKSYHAGFPEASELFINMKRELVSTFSESFRQRHIGFNLVDTDFKFDRVMVQQKLYDDFIGRGFQLSLQEFNGRYILFNSLIQNYNRYGYHFFPELQELLTPRRMMLPSHHPESRPIKKRHLINTQQDSQLSTQGSYSSQFDTKRDFDKSLLAQNTSVVRSNAYPLWKGPLKTWKGRSIGKAHIHPFYKSNTNYNPYIFSLCSTIELHPAIDRAQFDLSWLRYTRLDQQDNDFIMIPDFDNGPCTLFMDFMDSLYTNGQIGMAQLVPFKKANVTNQVMCILPMTKGCAVVRFLNITQIPSVESLSYHSAETLNIFFHKQSISTLHEIYHDVKADKRERMPLNVTPSDELKQIVLEHKKQMDEEKNNKSGNKKANDGGTQKEEEEEMVIKLPQNTNGFKEAIEGLYFETLYERKNDIDMFTYMVDHFVKHMVEKKVSSAQEVIEVLKNIAQECHKLDDKHQLKIKVNRMAEKPVTNEKEDGYIYDWWQKIKEQELDDETEDENLILLRVTDARINTILYCFLAQLTRKHLSESSQSTEQEVKRFIKQASGNYETTAILPPTMEIALKVDSELDEVDKDVYNFLYLLENWFKNDIPEFTDELRENYYDELVPTTYLDGANIPLLLRDYMSQELEKPKTNEKTLLELLAEEKASKTTRQSSLDNMFKTVEVIRSKQHEKDRVGEATKQAIDKVNRSIVDGKPTMRRAGGFLVSAVSPERRASEPSTRKKDFDPSLTPRSSLNRFLGTDVFKQFTEDFPSPSVLNTNPNKRYPDDDEEEEDEDEFGLDDLSIYTVEK